MPRHKFEKGNKLGGRPKANHTIEAEKARQFIISKLIESLEPIVSKMIEQAKKGDRFAREELFNRAMGKAPQALELPKGSGEIVIKWRK